MKSKALVAVALNLPLAGSARAQDMGALYRRIDQLENEVQQLRTRVDNLGPAFAPRQVRIVDPVLSARGARRGSCVILFGKPDNPMGQLRSLVGGPLDWRADRIALRSSRRHNRLSSGLAASNISGGVAMSELIVTLRGGAEIVAQSDPRRSSGRSIRNGAISKSSASAIL